MMTRGRTQSFLSVCEVVKSCSCGPVSVSTSAPTGKVTTRFAAMVLAHDVEPPSQAGVPEKTACSH